MCKNDVEKWTKNPGDELANLATIGSQMITGGWAGYDFKKGEATEGLNVSAIKEMTGTKAAEEANELAQEQFENQKREAEKSRSEARARTARDQISASRLAESGRRSSTQSKTNGNNGGALSSTVSKLGSDEQDFLGL